MAPINAARTTTWVTCDGSTIPFPIVVATCVETSAPTKFSPAAMRIAFRIERARVEMQVAMALAVSWKPLMKSNDSAATITSARSANELSGILERYPFEDVRGVFAAVGGRLQGLVDLLPFQDHDGVLLVLEKIRDRVAADAVRLVLQRVHLDAMLVHPVHLLPHVGDPPVELAHGLEDQESQLLGLGGRLGELVEGDARGRRVDEVDDVVEGRGQRQDVLALDRSDEGRVQLLDDVVGDRVPLVLDLLDLPGLLLDVVEGVQKAFQELGAVLDVLGGLLEQDEEFLVTRNDAEHGAAP